MEKIKENYKNSFKDRFKGISENSLRAKLYRVRYDTVYEMIRFLPPNMIILDAGCGDGVFLSKSFKSNKNIIGLDLSMKSLRQFKTHIEANSAQQKYVPLINGDIESLPIRCNCLDTIVCIETIEHLIDVEKALKEFRRVLKPEGNLIVTVPSAMNPRNLITVLNTVNRKIEILWSFLKGTILHQEGYIEHTWSDVEGNIYPHKVYFKWKIKKVIENNGYTIKSIKNTGLIIHNTNGLFSIILNLFQSILQLINRFVKSIGQLFVIEAIKKDQL